MRKTESIRAQVNTAKKACILFPLEMSDAGWTIETASYRASHRRACRPSNRPPIAAYKGNILSRM